MRMHVSSDRMALFTFCVTCRDSAKRRIFGGCTPRRGAGLWPANSNLAHIFVQLHLSPSFIVLCLLVRKLSCWHTNPQTNRPTHKQIAAKTSNVFRYATTLGNQITSVGLRADPSFLAVRTQVTLVINPVVGCRYFPPSPQLLSQPKRSHRWPVPNYTAWWQISITNRTGNSGFRWVQFVCPSTKPVPAVHACW